MPRAVPLLLLSLLALTAGCGDEPAPSLRVLRPGDSLLERLPELKLREHALTRVPLPLRDSLSSLLSGETVSLPADAWHASGALQLPEAFLARLQLEQTAQRWSCRPAVPLDLPLGMVWFEHDGARLERVRRDAGDPQHRWSDRKHETLFWWDADSGRLLAFGTVAPRAIRYGFEERADGVGLRDFEPEWGAASSTDAAARLAARELSGVTRPALALMAPATLQLKVDRLEAEALDVQIAVPALGLRRQGPRLSRDSAASDGVTFAVELLPLGAAAEAKASERELASAQRVWSQHVLSGESWVHARVDLSAWVGRGCVLRLVVEPGPNAHSAFDYALWSGLRLRGGARGLPSSPHVIVIDADTLRADRLGIYGAEHATSPRLDAWAAREAIVFEQARATADWTLPSTASLLTGLDVGQHGVVNHLDRLQPEHVTLAEHFSAAGYETWARTDSGFVTATYGFADGFDVFDSGRRDDGRPRDGRELLARLEARESERPVFVFFQTYEVHAPFPHDDRFVSTPLPADDLLLEKPITEEFVRDVVRRQGAPLNAAQQRYISELYDAGVARLDAQLGRFLDGLPRALGGEPHLVVITSDHGEELFERGELGHGHSLHRELLHVPLLLRLPEGPRGVRRAAPVSGLDLVPTLLAAAGLPIPDTLSGRVLLHDSLPSEPIVAQNHDAAWALEWQGFKLMHGRMGSSRRAPERSALFDLSADPQELVDLAGADPRRHEALLEQLEAWRAAHGPLLSEPTGEVTLSTEQRQALQELGYLDDG